MKPSAKLGYQLGAIIALAMLVIIFLPGQESFHALGPANTGHEELGCQDCHISAPGTARQQIQANMRYWIGLRTMPVDFLHEPVMNANCIDCHENPQDNHPVHIFNEPRFAEARVAIAPQNCVSCHLEHEGKRVTAEITYCVECHADLSLPNDPIDISHEQLIADEAWESCLGCHDFHGNHKMELATSVDEALTPIEILQYFEGGPSPYSDEKFYQAKEQ